MLEQPRRGEHQLVPVLPGKQDQVVVLSAVIQAASFDLHPISAPHEATFRAVVPPGKYDSRYWNEGWEDPRALWLEMTPDGQGSYVLDKILPSELRALEENNLSEIQRRDNGTIFELPKDPIKDVSRFFGSQRDLGEPVGDKWFMRAERPTGVPPRTELVLPHPLRLSRGQVLIAGMYFEGGETVRETGKGTFGWIRRIRRLYA